MRLRNHLLFGGHLDRLADGEGTRQTIDMLWAAERSRRLLLLRAILDGASSRPGITEPLPSVDDLWNSAAAVHEADPAAFAEVLKSPQFGTWASRMVRLLSGAAHSAAPLWIDMGYLHAAVLAAAFRAKVSFATRIPVIHGGAFLPTLGMARFPAVPQWNMAEAETLNGHAWLWCDGQKVAIPDDPGIDGPDWWAIRRISVRAGDRVLSPSIDDIDPYRDLADPVLPARLDLTEIDRWKMVLSRAWRIIDDVWPTAADAMSSGLISLSPLPADARETRTASSGDAFGAALISRPPDPVTLAVGLVHEFQHVKLGGLLHLAPLLSERASSTFVYAPWRDDPRPLAGLLQGVYAFCGIATFWDRYRHVAAQDDRAAADFEFAYARRQTRTGLTTLLRSPLTTEIGRRFLHGLATRVRRQIAQPVPVDLTRLAWAAAVDHRAAWRIRHLHPDSVRIHQLAEAFAAGRPARAVDSVRCELVPDTRERWYQSRLALQRFRLQTPERFAELASRGGPIPAAAHGAVQADVALVNGNLATAESGYRAMIAAAPGDIAAWTGLAVATTANRSTHAWRLLVRRPEFVRAVYLAVRQHRAAISPTIVAEWLDAESTRPGRARIP